MSFKKFLAQAHHKVYRTMRFGAGRPLAEPLLRVKIGGASLGHHIWNTITALHISLFYAFKETIIRADFAAKLVIPRGYKQVTLYIEGYEPGTTALISHLLKPGMTMVDIGAHLGYYTLLAALKVGKEGRVFAFEPDPYYFQFLTRNLKLNGIKECVYTYQMAVADKDGTTTFFPDRSDGRGNLYVPVIYTRKIIVPTVALDSFFERLGWPKVDPIKIDVEGAEEAVFKGMKELSRRNKFLRLVVEFSAKRPSGIYPLEFFNTLQQFGFTRCYVIDKPWLCEPTEIIRESDRVVHLNLLCEKS